MNHVAIMMDGNRRWARKKGFALLAPRQEGVDAVRVAATFCLKKKIRYLSLYTFSLENAQRDQKSVEVILKLLIKTSKEQTDELVKQGIRVRFIGARHMFPSAVMGAIEHLENKTKDCSALYLNMLFYYGARQEIAHATREIARKVASGQLAVDQITDDTVHKHLWTGAAGIPDPDIVVRPGGKDAMRMSNFLLYQASYSELFFLDCLWPEITEEDLQACYDTFQKITRNFGK